MVSWWLIGLSALVLATVFFIIWFFRCLFFKIVVQKKGSMRQKVVFRTVFSQKKDSSLIQKEQTIYIKRAKSLWGKIMKSWPIFRIYFPEKPNVGVFGIIVPESFQIEEDCLKELGFVLGELEYSKETYSIDMPMIINFASTLNRFRCVRQLKKISKTNPYIDIQDYSKRKQSFVMVTGELSGLWDPRPN